MGYSNRCISLGSVPGGISIANKIKSKWLNMASAWKHVCDLPIHHRANKPKSNEGKIISNSQAMSVSCPCPCHERKDNGIAKGKMEKHLKCIFTPFSPRGRRSSYKLYGLFVAGPEYFDGPSIFLDIKWPMPKHKTHMTYT